MKKWFSLLVTAVLLFAFIPTTGHASDQNLRNASKDVFSKEKLQAIEKYIKEKYPEHVASSDVYIDKNIDTTSEQLTKVIVEYNSAPMAVQKMLSAKSKISFNAQAAAKLLEQEQAQVATALKKQNIAFTETSSFQTVFNGAVVEMKGSDVPKLKNIKGIRAVYANNAIQAVPGIEVEKEIKAAMKESAPMIGSKDLWDLGYTGKGLKIGVIDTGIDYNHPDLKGAYKGGYDFIDNDNDPFEGSRLIPTSHGTHVSGIVAGRGNPEKGGVRGVAYESDLYVYRVLSEEGGSDETVIAGIEKAVEDGMDIINLSLGSTYNHSDAPTARAVNNAMLAGVLPVVASGNTGTYHYGTVNSPGTAEMALTVGATIPNYYFYSFKGKASATADKDYVLEWSTEVDPVYVQPIMGEHEIVYVQLGVPENYDGKDVKGKYVLIKGSPSAFYSEINAWARDAGAIGVIVFGFDGWVEPTYDWGWGTLPLFTMRADEGRALAAAMESKEGPHTFTFTETLKEEYPYSDKLVEWSSDGPVADTGTIKPDVVAPGVAITSTVPAFYYHSDKDEIKAEHYKNAYDSFSGTSMASPHVAGLAALLMQARPEMSTFDIKTLIMNTGLLLGEPINEWAPHNVLDIGSGRVQGKDALESPVLAQVMEEILYTKTPVGDRSFEKVDNITGSINFGQFGNETDTKNKSVALKNTSGDSLTYDVTFDLKYWENQYPRGQMAEIFTKEIKPMEELPAGVQLTLGTGQVTVKGHGTGEVPVSITVPEDAPEGVYEGYIHLKPTSPALPDLQVPFIAYKNARIANEFMGFDMDLRTLNMNDPAKNHSKMEFEFLHDMSGADIYLYDIFSEEFELGHIKSLSNEELTSGTHSFVWDGQYQKENGETIRVQSGMYMVIMIAQDARGYKYTRIKQFYALSEKTQLTLQDYYQNENKEMVVNKNEIIGVAKSTAAMLARELNADEDPDLKNPLILRYEIKQGPYIYTYGTLDYLGTFENEMDEITFWIRDQLPAGKSVLTIWAEDKVGNVTEESYNVFYDKDISVSDPLEIFVGKDLIYNLTANNVEKLIAGEFEVAYRSDVFTFDHAIATNEFKEMASNTIVTHHVGDEYIGADGHLYRKLLVGASLQKLPNGHYNPGNGNIPLVTVYFKSKNDARTVGKYKMDVTKAQYIQDGEYELTKVPLDPTDFYAEIMVDTIYLNGKFHLEAHTKPDGSPKTDMDYSMGRIEFYDSETGEKLSSEDGYRGGVLRGYISRGGDPTFVAYGLHPNKTYDIRLFWKGHFSGYIKGFQATSVNEDGSTYVDLDKVLDFGLLKAGDTDKNNRIDIYDVALVSRYFGLSAYTMLYFNPPIAGNADINFDGTIDILDLSFVTTNYGEIGHDPLPWDGWWN
ncbi:S8 family serine peptidase [Pseudoneobacillus sp. C159]